MNELINHLWQSTAFVLLIALAAKALRRNSPRLRYWLWLTASIKFLIPFSLIVSTGARIQLPPEIPLPHADTVVQISTYFEPASAFEPVSAMYFEPASELSTAVPGRAGFPWRLAVTAVWLMGGFLLAVRWFRRWRTVHRAVERATRLPIQSSVPILSSPALMEPGVFGFFRPVLLLPEGIAEKLTAKQFEAVLAHELRHIRCFDNLTAAVHMGVETLFWFHPLVWWIGAKLMGERERDCDETALRQGSQPADYARGILLVCDTYVKTELACASGISGSDLKKRVQEIMTWRGSLPVTLPGKAILISAAIAAVSVPFSIGVVRAAQTEPIRVQNLNIPSQIAPTPIRPAAAQTSTRSGTPQTQPQPEAPPNIVGDYIGVFSGPGLPEGVNAKLHIKADAGGKLSGTLEFPGQGTVFPLIDIRVKGQSLSFTVPIEDDRWKNSFGDSWKGSIENNGARLNGAFTQELSMQLIFTRETAQTPTRLETPQTQPRPEAAPNAILAAGIPKWEVVSVRPCPPDVRGPGRGRGGPRDGSPSLGGPFRFSADRMTLNCLTVRSLIRSAYHIYLDVPHQGSPMDGVLARGVGEGRRNPTDGTDGGPDWVDTDLYTIEAKAEGVTDRALMQGPMLQSILEDRFKMKVHRETREMAVDALVIASGGSKLKPFVEGSCVRRPAGYNGTPQPSTRGQQRYCRIEGGDLNLNNNRVNIVYRAEGVTIDEFVKLFVNGYRSRFVIDKTGLAGKFDIHLESEISAELRQRIGDLADVIGPSTAPPLPEALQQQLGLKLESTKGPVEFLVVDHIERPSPN